MIVPLLLMGVWPAFADAQTTRAGVVTTLEGNVTAARGGLPQPVALKFKDDVLLQDRITTGDQSLARLLLGGKAVVTIRERSALTITEVPGRSTVNLDSGKIAMAVAQAKMRPGESVEVRTPNAVAGVRGTVFVVEVSRTTAQVGGGAGAATTSIYTIGGTVNVQLLSPTGQVLTTLTVPANGFASITGSAPPTSGTMTPEQRAAALSGLQAKTQPASGAAHEGAKSQAMTTTVALANAITGGGAPEFGRGPTPGKDTPESGPKTQQDRPIIDKPLPFKDKEVEKKAVTQDLPDIEISNTTKTLGASENLKTFTGTVNRSGSSPVVKITNSTVTGGLNVFFFNPSAGSVTLAGPLLQATGGSTLSFSNDVADGGESAGTFPSTFTSTTSSALVQLDNSSLTAKLGGHLDGGSVNLKGPLLKVSNGGTLSLTGELLKADSGGQLIVTGSTDPLVSITGGTHSIASGSSNPPVFSLTGRSGQTTTESADGVTLTLGTDKPLQHGGVLVEASGATITTGGGVKVDIALLEASAPLLSLKASSTVTTQLDALNLVAKAKVTSVGPIAKLDASTLTVTSGAAALVQGGSFLKVTGDLFVLNNAATLKLLNGAALSVVNSVVNISGALVNFGGSGNNLLSITNTLCSSSCTSIGGVNVFLTNGASSSNVSITNHIKNSSLGTVSLSNSETTAVISVSGSTSKVTISGD
jgi:hypothetical protein